MAVMVVVVFADVLPPTPETLTNAPVGSPWPAEVMTIGEALVGPVTAPVVPAAENCAEIGERSVTLLSPSTKRRYAQYVPTIGPAAAPVRVTAFAGGSRPMGPNEGSRPFHLIGVSMPLMANSAPRSGSIVNDSCKVHFVVNAPLLPARDT